MATVQMTGSVVAQLALGKSILSVAAKTPGVKVIQPSIDAFAAVQKEYAGAQRKAKSVGNRLGGTRMDVGELEVDVDAAVEAVARALVTDGGTRSNPFRDLDVGAPSAIIKLPLADKIAAVAELTAALRRVEGASKAALAAADAADQAAEAARTGLADIEKHDDALDVARSVRAAVGQRWAMQFAALKRAAMFAKDNGAPHLYGALFDRERPAGTRGKSAKKNPVEPSTPANDANGSGSSPETVQPNS